MWPFFWLLSLNIILLKFTYTVAYINFNPFLISMLTLYRNENILYISTFMWLNNILFMDKAHLVIHSSADARVDCFHLWTIVMNAAVNTGVQALAWNPCSVLWDIYTRSGTAGSYGNFDFMRNWQIVLQRLHRSASQVSPTSLTTFHFLDYGKPSWCEGVSHCDFDLQFLSD